MKKVEVDKSLCIGCGACMQIAGEVFKMGDDGLSEVKLDKVSSDNKDVIIAVESCPTEAIKLETLCSCNNGECQCDENCSCGCNHDHECTCK